MTLPELAYAFGAPRCSGRFRQELSDFVVDEVLGFNFGGEGEHVVLWVEKRGQNTQWLAQQIARIAGVGKNDVGYCGLKDRQAITRQWFSVYCPKSAALKWSLEDWRCHEIEGTSMLALNRHQRKLRPGDHARNQFSIRLREVSDAQAMIARIELAKSGVPNYFGEQRFGHDHNNLRHAEQMFSKREGSRQLAGADRKQRGLIISAARSHLFNQVLSARILQDNWRNTVEGEVGDESSGPLWGRGRNLAAGELARLEAEVLAPWAHWCEGLEHVGLSQERRALVCLPGDLAAEWEDNDCVLDFSLAPGQYATAVLREITAWESVN